MGSTRLVWDDETGTVKFATHYYPYGKQFVQTASAGPEITQKFTGKELDDGIDLMYFGARYYDQDLGLWISPDPERQFVSPYLYSGNGSNPINALDEDGGKLVFSTYATPAYKADFARAVQYLNKGGVGATLAKLEADPTIITITPTTGGDQFDPNVPAIFWSGNALKTTEGKVMTPALVLLHEGGHALQWLKNPTKYATDATTLPVKAGEIMYDTYEEMRVIQKLETPAARKLGEPTRTNHRGTLIKVKNSTSTK